MVITSYHHHLAEIFWLQCRLTFSFVIRCQISKYIPSNSLYQRISMTMESRHSWIKTFNHLIYLSKLNYSVLSMWGILHNSHRALNSQLSWKSEKRSWLLGNILLCISFPTKQQRSYYAGKTYIGNVILWFSYGYTYLKWRPLHPYIIFHPLSQVKIKGCQFQPNKPNSSAKFEALVIYTAQTLSSFNNSFQ